MQDDQTGEGVAVDKSTHPVPNQHSFAMLYNFIVPGVLDSSEFISVFTTNAYHYIAVRKLSTAAPQRV
jgi:hypothetical protein